MNDDTFVPCDECRQRSYVFVLLESGRDLAFCGHHGRKHTPALKAQGAVVNDYSAYIGFS